MLARAAARSRRCATARAPLDLRARSAAARRGSRAPSRGTACWRARAARRRAARPARRSRARARGSPRCRTTFSVSGRPSSRTQRGDARASARARRRPRCAAAARAASSWNESCTRVEPARRELREPRALERHAARDQVRVELAARAPRRRAPRGRRAASGSPPVRFTCTTPSASASRSTRRHVGGVELAAARRELDRVRAVHAAQRAAVGELGDQRVRARRRAHGSSPRSRLRSASSAGTRAPRRASASFGPWRAASVSMISRTASSPVHRPQDLGRGRVQREALLGVEQRASARTRDRPAAAPSARAAGRASSADHRASPVRLHAVEQVPEDLGLAHQRRDAGVLQLGRGRVRDHELDRLAASRGARA